jgi:hypothetical protein
VDQGARNRWRGVKEYPSMPIVAAVALAIAVIETNNPRNAIKALSRGNTRSIIIGSNSTNSSAD